MVWLAGARVLTQRQLLIYAVMPAAYLVSGRLALLLAVPPGYATAVFPPAGIALGAMFIAGAATLPGTFLGAFLLNISLGYSVAQHPGATPVAAALVITSGHVVQAAIGGTVLRGVIGYPAPLDNPRDLILFLLLSPVFCLASASLSLSGLWALGAVQPPELMTNWMTWWVGDTLGVLVVLPLMLVLGGQPRTLWRSRARFVAVPMMLCFALFAAIFIRLSSWENERSLREFQLRSQQLADMMKEALDEQALFLEQLSAVFVNRHLQVGRQDFRDLVQKLRQRFPAIQAVEWAPRVVSAERRAFEAAQEADFPGFEIRERDPLSQLRPAGDRGQFYPVTYLEPFTGNEEAAGYDLASDADRHAAMEAAIASGKATATAPIRLVQERGQQAGILLVSAVPGGPNGPAGVVLVALRMGEFAMALADPLASMLRLRLLDATGAQPLLDGLPPSIPASYETAFNFGTRRYAVQTAPFAVYLAQHRGWQSFTVLAAGTLTTGLLGALLMLGTGHAYRFERLAGMLREREERLRLFIEYAPVAVAMFDREMRYLAASSRWLNDYRLDVSVLGRSHYEVFPKLPDRWKEVHRRALTGEIVAAKEDRFDRADGAVQWLHWEVRPWRSEGAATGGIIIFAEDITERKTVEQALRESEARLAAILEQLPVGVALMDRKGRFTARNAMLQRWVAEAIPSLDQIAAGRWRAFDKDGRVLAQAEWPIARALRGETIIPGVDFLYTAEDGSERWTRVGAAPFRHETGELSGALTVAQDIDTEKRAEQANLVLIGELQHRTRNLLAVVQSIARQTIRGRKGFSEFETLFNDRLSALSRAQRFLSLPDDQPATCGDVVRAELAALVSELDGSRVVLEGPAIPLSRHSVQILALALHELATNALKHGALSKPQGLLAVKWRLLDSNGQGRKLSLDWLESGIDLRQTDRSSIRRGFGRELIETALVYQLGAKTRFELSDSGLYCMIEIPVGSPRSSGGE